MPKPLEAAISMTLHLRMSSLEQFSAVASKDLKMESFGRFFAYKAEPTRLKEGSGGIWEQNLALFASGYLHPLRDLRNLDVISARYVENTNHCYLSNSLYH